jgi:hypothetical protein
LSIWILLFTVGIEGRNNRLVYNLLNILLCARLSSSSVMRARDSNLNGLLSSFGASVDYENL